MRAPRFGPIVLMACGVWALGTAAFGTRAGAAGTIPVQSLGRAEGLPSGQAHAVVEGPEGKIWIAGPGGLAVYDGERVRTLRREDGLSTQGLRSLAVDGVRLWIGTDLGGDRMDVTGKIAPLPTDAGWPYGFVEEMAIGRDGRVWLAAQRGLVVWDPRSGARVADPLLDGPLVTSVAVADGGEVWAAGPAVGLVRGDGEAWAPPPLDGWREAGQARVLALAASGHLLVGGDRGLVEIDARGTLVRRLDGGPKPGAVTAILELERELWLGIDGQLRLYRPSATGWVLEQVVLEGALVNHLSSDRYGNVWIATDNAGVGKVTILRRAVERAAAPCVSQVFSIVPTSAGDKLIGGDACSWRMSADGSEVLETFDELARIKVWDLLETTDGSLWAATELGLYRRPVGGAFAAVGGRAEALLAPGRVLLERDGELWVGTVAGLLSGRGRVLSAHTDAEGDSLGYVYTLVEDPEGRLWVGTIGNGLWREAEGGVFERFVAGGISEKGNCYAVAFDASGRMAVVQDDRMLVVADGEVASIVPAVRDAVAGWSALFDEEGALWVGGSSGLVRYDPVERRATLRLTGSMGLAGEEFTTSRSLFLDRSGRLFCGLAGGLTRVDPGALESLDSRPEIGLAELSWTHAELSHREGRLEVASGRWTLNALAYSPWFVDERSLLFRHRLIGFDDDWSEPEPAATHRMSYTALPAGDYRLEAAAHSPLVGWGPAASLVEFTVPVPWSRGWPGTALWATLALFAGGLIWVLALSIGRATRRRLEAEVRQRTAELRRVLRLQEHLAHHDELTDLPNRRSFSENVDRLAALSRRHGKVFALLELDLDDFKAVNDRYGHQVGDELLTQVAQRLRGAVREEDLVARLGGDEFGILLSEASAESVKEAASRICARLEERPYALSTGITLEINGCLGAALWRGPEDDQNRLLRRADAALYRAKASRAEVRFVLDDDTVG